jgi:hypothetical protein
MDYELVSRVHDEGNDDDDIIEVILSDLPIAESDEKKESESEINNNGIEELNWFQTAQAILRKGLPMALTYCLGGLTNFTLLYFAGHLYNDADPTITFAGVSMSMLFTNISGRSIIIGMTGAVETLGLRLSTLASLFNSLIT